MDLAAFLASPGGLALKGALVAAFLDFAVGSFYALKQGTFALDAVAAFVRKHLLGRVFPLATLLIAGYLTGDVTMNAAAAAGLVAYGAETMASVYGSITESKAQAASSIPQA